MPVELDDDEEFLPPEDRQGAVTDRDLRSRVSSVAYALAGSDNAARMLMTRRLEQAASDSLGEYVTACIASGWSWARVGSAIGMSRQAAWERFSKRLDS